MKILFLSVSSAISNINNRGIYPDLLRFFSNEGHDVFIVCPFERRIKKNTMLFSNNNIQILGVRTLNFTKTNLFEKVISYLLIQKLFEKAIEKYFCNVKFDLILYATPPITFISLVRKLKIKNSAKTYLLLKDIFPQNAVDLGMFTDNSFVYKYFRSLELQLYNVSDVIGCMSQANVNYLLKHNRLNSSKIISICPNAIEIVDRFTVNREEILKKYHIPETSTVFIFGGNIGVPQSVEILIYLFQYFKNRSDCFFVVAGNGSKARLIERWIKANNPLNILFLSMLERKEYDELESCCDVGIITLDKRFTIPNFPSRLLSYLECKIPILLSTDLSTDIGIIAENNGFGKWSSSSDLEKLIDNALFFIENNKTKKEMGQKGYSYLHSNYTVSKAYKQIINDINKLI
jgi:glycosyltransferase involved in cell wall biosynthesis